MRVFLLVLVLIFSFQSLTKADDIRDFEIEGMSIGDSLLDYFSKNEIINGIRNYGYPVGFYASGFREDFFEIYNTIEIHLKNNDNKYIIYALDGLIFYKNINVCYKKMNEIETDLSQQFSNIIKNDQGIVKHSADNSGKSTVKRISWKFDNGDLVALECYYWSKQIKKKYPSWSNHLRISFTKKELDDWLRNN